MTSTRPAAPLVLVRAPLLALLLAAATLVALPAPWAVGAGDRVERWAGYRIPSTGRAAGGWIGGYRVGRTPVFVITPERRPNRAGVRAADPTRDLQGRSGPTRRETQRAAWILSKYGGYKDAAQAASVDAAVLHLLGDRAWRLGGRRGAARVRASGDPATVRRFVRLMLRSSRASAGRYRAAVLATTADVGGVTAVTVRVTDGHGGPVSGLPVTVTSPDGGTSQPAAGPVEAVTGDDGRALVRLAAPLAGWRTVVAHVGQVPEHRLRVRGAERRGQAALAEGGVRRTVVASARVAVRGPQSLTLAANPTQLVVGSWTRVVATVAGDGATRTATATLHGPFATASLAQCTGSPVASVSSLVERDGDYPFSPITMTGGGYYAWRVEVEGTATSVPVSACGATAKVRSRATTVVSDAVVTSFGEVRATGTVSGIPFPDQVTVRGRLAGPYDSADGPAADRCSTFDTEAVRVRTGNGQVQLTVVPSVTGKYYAWIAETSPGDLWVGQSSTCAASGSVVFVP